MLRFKKQANGNVLITDENDSAIAIYSTAINVFKHKNHEASLVLTDDTSPQEVSKGYVISYASIDKTNCDPPIAATNIEELIVELSDSFFFEVIHDLKYTLEKGNKVGDGQIIEHESNAVKLDLRKDGLGDSFQFGTDLSNYYNTDFGFGFSLTGFKFNSLNPNIWSEFIRDFNSQTLYLSIVDASDSDPNNHRRGGFVILDNILFDKVSTGFVVNSPPSVASVGKVTAKKLVKNSFACGLLEAIMKTDYAIYINQLAYNNGSDFETLVKFEEPTITNKELVFPNKNGKIEVQKAYRFATGSITRSGQTTKELINQQANIFEEFLRLEFTPTESDVYRFGSSLIWSMNNTANNFLVKFSIVGGSINEEIIMRKEPKDAGGSGIVVDILQGGNIVGTTNTGTDQKLLESYLLHLPLESGETYVFKTEFTSDLANAEACIYTNQLWIEQKTIQ